VHRLLALVLLLAVPLAGQQTALESGRAALERGDPRSAAPLLEQAVAQSPQNADAHYYLGVAYGRLAEKANVFRRGSLARRTRTEFERAVELNPNHLDARSALVQYYLQAPQFLGGSESKAEDQANEIAKRDAAGGHRAFALIADHRKDYKTELSELEAAVALDPKDMDSLFEIGRVAAVSGFDLQRGDEALKKYLAHTPRGDEPPLDRAYYWAAKIRERETESQRLR